MQILRYTEAIQKQLGSKTKPEPWLHCAIYATVGKDMHVPAAWHYSVYVWDTRKVIESSIAYLKRSVKFIKGQPANDNHQPLVGGDNLVQAFNRQQPFNKSAKPKPGNEAAPADLQIAPETVAKLLPMLKSAYAEEVNAWYQYYIIAPFLAGKERANVVADYAENGNEELKHASMLLERINQLGGDFTDIEALDKLDAIAKAKYIKPTSTDVAVSLQQIVDAEKGAIETYTALEEASRDIDVVTNRLVKQILEDEQKHLQEALDFLADIK